MLNTETSTYLAVEIEQRQSRADRDRGGERMWWLIGDGAKDGAGWMSTLDARELHSAVAFRCCLLHATGPPAQQPAAPWPMGSWMQGAHSVLAAYLIAAWYVLFGICF